MSPCKNYKSIDIALRLFIHNLPWFVNHLILHWTIYSCYMYLGLWASWYCIELFINDTSTLVYDQVDIGIELFIHVTCTLGLRASWYCIELFINDTSTLVMSKLILHWAIYSCYMYLGLWARWYCIELFIHVTCTLVYEQVDIALSYLFMLHVTWFMSKLILHWALYSCYMYLGLWASWYCIELFIHVTCT